MNKNLPVSISALRSFSSLAKPSTVNLGLGKPLEDMPLALRKLAEEVLKNPALKMDYSENAGFLAVRTLLERRYQLKEGSALLTHGSQEGLFACFLALLNSGDEVLIPNPGFLAYAPIVRSLGAKPVLYRLKGADFAYSLPEIRKKVSRRTRVILINSPANPTGTVISADFIRELAAEFPKLTVVSDEVYGELHYREPYTPFCRYSANVVSVNAFSKSHALTGWRIGWLATANEALLNRILVAHQYVATCASVPAQHLAGALMADEALFESIRDHYCTEYVRRRDELFRNLGNAGEGLGKPDAGFYAFLPIPKRFPSSLAFAEHLLKKKDVLVIPGEFFGSAGKRHVRFSFSASIDAVRAGAIAIAEYSQ